MLFDRCLTWLTEMRRRSRRLSADGEHTERRAASPSCCDKSRCRCPSCGQLRLSTVNVDGLLHISTCDACNRGYGVDDSMDAETLAELLVDEDFCRYVEMTAVTCRQCFNSDIYCFVIVEEPNPDRPVLRVRCKNCSGISDIPLKDWTADASWNCDDAWLAEALGNMYDGDEDAGGSLLSDCDSGYAVDSDDDQDVAADLDVLPFSCRRCGNNEVACFEQYFDDASGDLSMVKCFNCDDVKVLDTFFGVECGHCENDRKELFERYTDDYGRVILLRCLECGRRLKCPGQPDTRKGSRDGAHVNKVPRSGKSVHSERQAAKVASRPGLGWTKISDLRHVRRGDHVAWHKWYAIWHHAIVVDIPDGGRALTVIHSNGDIVKLDGHFASVRQETLDVNPKKEDFYRIDYPTEDVYPPEEVVRRAIDRLGEAKYNPLTNNCEHFACWCKTGNAHSGQVRKFTDRLAFVSGSAAAKAILEGAADGVESFIAGSLSTVGRLGSSIPQRVGQVLGATSVVARNVKFGALACNVAINIGLEAGLLTRDVVRAHRKYKSGAISCDEFRRMLGKHGCEGLGGLLGGSAMGILGQVFIPIPFLGGAVGCTLGSLIGRYIGAIVGKQIAAIKHS